MSEPPSGNSIPPGDPRVRFAAERTLLAWTRTGLALMGFGFVVARFGLFLRQIAASGGVSTGSTGRQTTGWSLWIGMCLIVLGVLVNVAASYEYFRFLRMAQRNLAYTPRTALLTIFVSGVLAVVGMMMAVYLALLSS